MDKWYLSVEVIFPSSAITTSPFKFHAKVDKKQIYFVTRMKKNADYDVIQVTRKHYREKGQVKVLGDESFELHIIPRKMENDRHTPTGERTSNRSA